MQPMARNACSDSHTATEFNARQCVSRARCSAKRQVVCKPLSAMVESRPNGQKSVRLKSEAAATLGCQSPRFMFLLHERASALVICPIDEGVDRVSYS